MQAAIDSTQSELTSLAVRCVASSCDVDLDILAASDSGQFVKGSKKSRRV